MPGWDVTVRPAKEEKKKDDNTTWVIVVVLLALLLLLLYGGGGQQQGPDRGPGQGCVQRDGSRCDQGLGSGGHRWDGRGSGHHDDDRDARDQGGP
jgi:hypothetical protein